mmetsp:Transcript_118897/g.341546  ORF Transcript_118897/g.341546 Transcript_118897/m.341546 type:complete len:549 (-) Transcript_118897:97-1743(-)
MAEKSAASAAGMQPARPEDPLVPSLFRKDRLRLQCVCLMCLAYTLSQKVSIFDRFDAVMATTTALLPLDAIDLPVLRFPVLHKESFDFGAVQGWQVCLMAVVVVISAIWEATRFPRQAAHATAVDALKTLLVLIGDLLLLPIYIFARPETPLLGYQNTERNTWLLQQCPSLFSFKQTPWFRNPNISFAALMWLDSSGEKYRKFVRRELLTAPDGGFVALDWWEDRPDIAESKKILLIGSTFTGDALVHVTRTVCKNFSALGWMPVVMVKRGCGRTMPNVQPGVGLDGSLCDGGHSPAPWCLTGLSDFELAVDHIAAKFPGIPICSIGLSTGGGQLRSYFNNFGERSKIRAGVVVDAAPNWDNALLSLDRRLPLISKALAVAAMDSYVNCGRGAVTGGEGAGAGGDACSKDEDFGRLDDRIVPGCMVEFVRDHMGPCFGFERTTEGAIKYMNRCLPPESSHCAVPCLELMSFDDQLQCPEQARETHGYWKLSPNVITAGTRQGTHVIRWDGFHGACWLSKVTAEFCEAVLRSEDHEPHTVGHGDPTKER